MSHVEDTVGVSSLGGGHFASKVYLGIGGLGDKECCREGARDIGRAEGIEGMRCLQASVQYQATGPDEFQVLES